jgi:hypothetical protein
MMRNDKDREFRHGLTRMKHGFGQMLSDFIRVDPRQNLFSRKAIGHGSTPMNTDLLFLIRLYPP